MSNLAVVPDRGPITFADVLELFLKRCEEKGLEPATIRCYRYVTRSFLLPALGPKLASELTPGDFDALAHRMVEAGKVPSTIRKAVTCAGAALKLAERNELVVRNVARLAELPKNIKPVRDIPAPEALGRFLHRAAFDDIDIHDYARVMAGTGMRPGEACGLMSTDLDGDLLTIERAVDVCQGYARIKETKTGKVRRIVIDEHTAAIILSRPGPFVFGEGQHGGRTDLMSKRWKRVAVKAGVGFTPRAMRHFHATQLLASGKVNIKQLAERLGHANPTLTLSVYAQYVPALDQVAADVIGDVLDGDDE